MRINIVNPDLTKLCYIIAVANINDKHDRSAPSDFHWKILKCRMIIFSNSSILACPDKKDVKQVHIIFNKTGDDYDKLNSLFVKYSLMQDGGIKEVTPEIYEKCFHYTMTARIAPVWNTMEEIYLINNRDFLTTKGPQEGIKYNISVNQNFTTLEINAVKINLMISEEEFSPGEWIRVLPSLNKAMVEDSYKDFSQVPVSKFKSYKDIRRHWKNIHGYRLPEEETSYYSIQFWRGEPLLYPKLCVIRNFPIVTPTPKPLEKVIISRFLNCLNTKISNILGTPLTIQIQEMQQHDNNSMVPNDSLSETQAVSLCTPTQCSRISKQF
ncbi:uncharacterized protein C18orf63-like [Spodoptera frugiperda]|uniref:Uncharacterized protein C18orf63-like n=1 Tax=Spodoptera frugiperda TaxID=7108 RepID=A0A9R0DB40_SPOFR|nr:uncharacterized protein C18orf63-like [Spodoptera frugiperda]